MEWNNLLRRRPEPIYPKKGQRCLVCICIINEEIVAEAIYNSGSSWTFRENDKNYNEGDIKFWTPFPNFLHNKDDFPTHWQMENIWLSTKNIPSECIQALTEKHMRNVFEGYEEYLKSQEANNL